MDLASYKSFTTSRHLTYSYFVGLPIEEQGVLEPPLPGVLFIHGFPTSSRVWKHQVKHFQECGFAVLAVDLLGFGSSSKPCNPEEYRASLICKDVIELLDHEGFGDGQVIAVGHDLLSSSGSTIVARLANFYPRRCCSYAFVADPYRPPRPKKTLQYTLWVTKRFAGYELCGHSLFYADPSSEKLINFHLDSFLSLIFASDPKLWCTDLAPVGALESWVRRDRTTELAKYVSPEDLQLWRSSLSEGGIAAALCYYKAFIQGLTGEDDQLIPIDKYRLEKPAFLATAKHDYVSPALLAIETMKNDCNNLTIREFYEGHWIMMASPAKLNEALYSWIMDHI
ncbi:Alpha/Beta hydrolase protein [Crepidotus variabilis]|uniref:Alpha/Beta hydrolase protein n=1 Tax=Crepidotus variabilis TaxID=179855 RepID=A0A9P6E386_9AGAR|nr:Alpha/Beta hydrolase protein [Crepidotus variabilis]